MRVGILTSHPIQYQTPWFRALAREVDLHVYFAHQQAATQQAEAGFGTAFEWDIDLLGGFPHTFLRNVARQPNVNHFSGCDTPDIAAIIQANDTQHELQSITSFDAFIVNGWYLKSYMQAVKACRAAGVPVLVRGDSHLGTPRLWVKRWAMEISQRWLLQQFDGFLSVGQLHREYLEHYGVPPEKIFSAPHFVDNEWFAARAEEARGQRLRIRNEWKASDGDIVALFVGKFTRRKRPQDLLRALAKSRNRTDLGNRNLMAVFVGAGAQEGELRGIATRENLHVHFAGFKNQTELPAYYAAADVLVLPSSCETWGLVVNEAMACGLPAIVSDATGCAPDLIEDGKTGFVFPVGDERVLADRLAKIAERVAAGHDFRPALMTKMRTHSIETAVKNTLTAVTALRLCRA